MWHVLVFCIMLMLGPAKAQADSWEDCNQATDKDLVIRACTEVITKGVETGSRLALAYDHRCSAYREASFDEKDLREKALADCDKAIELDPNLVTPYSNRCSVYAGKGNDRAIADWDTAIELNSKFARAYAFRCGVNDIKNAYDQALSNCDKAIELDPDLALGYGARCSVYVDKGNFDRAIADCDKAIELDPKSMFSRFAYFNRARAYDLKGDTDSAVASYTKAIELAPKYADAYDGRCWDRAINAHAQQEQLQLAVLAFLVHYAHIAIPVVSHYTFETLLVAFLLLLAGNPFKGF